MKKSLAEVLIDEVERYNRVSNKKAKELIQETLVAPHNINPLFTWVTMADRLSLAGFHCTANVFERVCCYGWNYSAETEQVRELFEAALIFQKRKFTEEDFL